MRCLSCLQSYVHVCSRQLAYCSESVLWLKRTHALHDDLPISAQLCCALVRDHLCEVFIGLNEQIASLQQQQFSMLDCVSQSSTFISFSCSSYMV